jgi:hypothetical protein
MECLRSLICRIGIVSLILVSDKLWRQWKLKIRPTICILMEIYQLISHFCVAYRSIETINALIQLHISSILTIPLNRNCRCCKPVDLCQKPSVYLYCKTPYIWYQKFIGAIRSVDVLIAGFVKPQEQQYL